MIKSEFIYFKDIEILWILNNSLTSEDDLKTILTLASEKVEDAGWASYVREDLIISSLTIIISRKI